MSDLSKTLIVGQNPDTQIIAVIFGESIPHLVLTPEQAETLAAELIRQAQILRASQLHNRN